MQQVWELSAFVGLLLVFALFWCGICWLLAWLSGWRYLLVRFPTVRDPKGAGWRWVVGSFHADFLPVHFSRALIVHVDREGIRFACGLPSLGAFTPFLVPWGELQSVKTGRALFGRSAQIRIHGWHGTINIRGAAAEAALGGWSSYASTAGAATTARKERTPAPSGWQRILLFLRALAIFVASIATITFFIRQTLQDSATVAANYPPETAVDATERVRDIGDAVDISKAGTEGISEAHFPDIQRRLEEMPREFAQAQAELANSPLMIRARNAQNAERAFPHVFCDLARPAPDAWNVQNTRLMWLRLPPGTAAMPPDETEPDHQIFAADGIEIRVYSNVLGGSGVLESDHVVEIDGRRAWLYETRDDDGSGRLIATLSNPGDAAYVSYLSVAYASDALRDRACMIIGAARQLDMASELSLVQIRRSGSRPYALVRNRSGVERQLRVNDYATAKWGIVRSIEPDAIEIIELDQDRDGNWEERLVRLALGRNQGG